MKITVSSQQFKTLTFPLNQEKIKEIVNHKDKLPQITVLEYIKNTYIKISRGIEPNSISMKGLFPILKEIKN